MSAQHDEQGSARGGRPHSRPVFRQVPANMFAFTIADRAGLHTDVMQVLCEAHEITVSVEDAQGVRHRVFCGLRMPGGRRCLLRADHDGPCARRLRR